MSTNSKYDLVVIGGGPAGYAAAIRAGQLGKKVACVEQERPGGTCLNWGCIPSKALLKSAELFNKINHCEDFGITVKGASYDFTKIIQRSRGVSSTMAKGIEFLFKKNKVDYIKGVGTITVPGMVEVTDGPDKGKILVTDKTLIATGCKPRQLPDLEVDGERIMTSRQALEMKTQPKSIVIVGAGAIGAEFAYFLNAFGTKVTLVEMLDQVLPVEDHEVAAVVEKEFKKSGIDCRTSTAVQNIKVAKNNVKMDLVKGDKTESITVDAVLIAIGVVANTAGLLSPRTKLAQDRGYITVDANYESSVKGIYAAGDIIGPPWLAHVATYEAIQAVQGMFGHGQAKQVTDFPGCTYCIPQVASIGKTEKKLKEEGVKYKVGKFPFMASGKAVASGAPEGFVKLLVCEEYGEILGAHIVGGDATEMIGEYCLGKKLEATAEEIHNTIHAHPTLSEATMEAAAAVFGEAIHI
ncbi:MULTISPECIES: dihydrolipoyl dehydrogenase [unclassified Lentimonas]|uniref:dihydrolipoyl dehydrogenase n=1 Tax=unclassified Lentimonas TaxID=2630993 RepID=UPI00132A9D43|nr:MULTISPECIES: dihydrolipoyl dehydrogenase [unclassified Lentimonas]CAA6676901.1 Dihydrolipoamide dehydrogenase of 2-oxoglutarate dehydrogenase (EC [Lentimonas sp. CC4]CAA6686707.1 Dihydrolipoamide dehydrogenase of 2-oxoglutarate dehydrogenase (EC [Lentimonas sp. CC6]CAA6692938.1 Dihydrolipoamide dehydrogenase of 2-oxoglutarate dehydrogenase (EC [Lentimonas sp. CC10]CAA6695604.1 Dihydrolipoamide dehydrogenase of 2-oxoglutarate dehydrogenase (EC [Lentimonas sp. CC19]CAA7069932.1 Dihydrolipoam